MAPSLDAAPDVSRPGSVERYKNNHTHLTRSMSRTPAPAMPFRLLRGGRGKDLSSGSGRTRAVSLIMTQGRERATAQGTPSSSSSPRGEGRGMLIDRCSTRGLVQSWCRQLKAPTPEAGNRPLQIHGRNVIWATQPLDPGPGQRALPLAEEDKVACRE
ncbi:hypothetical protein VTN02DRAFT_4184 [Thermoascus thermophilus]